MFPWIVIGAALVVAGLAIGGVSRAWRNRQPDPQYFEVHDYQRALYFGRDWGFDTISWEGWPDHRVS